MLDGSKALLLCKFDVGCRHIVLEVDECLADGAAYLPQCVGCRIFEISSRGADHLHSGRQAARHEGGDAVIPDRLAVQMRGELQRRVPASGHDQQIAFQLHQPADGRNDFDTADAKPAERPPDHRTGEHGSAASLGHLAQFGGDFRTRINHGCNRYAGIAQCRQGAGNFIVICKDHGIFARCDAEAADITPHRAAQHHTWPVVIAEHQWPLDGAGGQHAGFGDDFPIALPRLIAAPVSAHGPPPARWRHRCRRHRRRIRWCGAGF